MLDGTSVRFIAALESPSAVRVVSRLGRTMPAHCTSTGKAMLANFSDEELHKLYPDPNLEQLTQNSVSTLTQLCAELVEVRKSGAMIRTCGSRAGVPSRKMICKESEF
jgi:DNA-binding IclR family transcriptional regulator